MYSNVKRKGTDSEECYQTHKYVHGAMIYWKYWKKHTWYWKNWRCEEVNKKSAVLEAWGWKMYVFFFQKSWSRKEKTRRDKIREKTRTEGRKRRKKRWRKKVRTEGKPIRRKYEGFLVYLMSNQIKVVQ